MAKTVPVHEEVLGMADARRGREARRLEDLRKREEAAAGTYHPTADELLRGFPLLAGDLRRDIIEFVEMMSRQSLDQATGDSLRRLGRTASRKGQIEVRGLMEALRACRLSPESDPEGTIRLRCVIYGALLGDVDAARAVAAEAALAAYVQDWHLEGDGSELVWQAAAWSAYAAAQTGPFRRLPYAITEMPSARDRVDAFADEFRLKVFRLLREVG